MMISLCRDVRGSWVTTLCTPRMPRWSAQMDHLGGLVGRALDTARLARRHLAHPRGDDRVAPPRDRGDIHAAVVLLEIDVTVGLAEGRLRLEEVGADVAFDDDLRLRGN